MSHWSLAPFNMPFLLFVLFSWNPSQTNSNKYSGLIQHCLCCNCSLKRFQSIIVGYINQQVCPYLTVSSVFFTLSYTPPNVSGVLVYLHSLRAFILVAPSAVSPVTFSRCSQWHHNTFPLSVTWTWMTWHFLITLACSGQQQLLQFLISFVF